jgi:hypothetical protein
MTVYISTPSRIEAKRAKAFNAQAVFNIAGDLSLDLHKFKIDLYQ